MKTEIEVPDELLEKLGIEAVQSYLTRKAEQLNQSIQNQSSEQPTSVYPDDEATIKAWQKFNKRGMSC